MLDVREPFVLGGGKYDAILDETGRRIVKGRVDA
jgi:hypothetical protein